MTNPQQYSDLRVLVVGSYANPDSFEWHLLDSLNTIGCATDLCYTAKHVDGIFALVEKARGKASGLLHREPERFIERRLFQKIDEFEPEIVLVVLGNQLSPKTMALLRKRTRARIVCWCQDHMTTLGRQFLVASGYDAVFLKDQYLLDLFSRMIRTTRFYYLPECCNPRVHRPLHISDADREAYECDVMIAGTLHYYRQEILLQLKQRSPGLKLKVWGSRPDWLQDRLPGDYMGRLVHGDDKVRAALAAGICLNTLHYGEVNSLNCRAFEIAGCGGFQLVTRVPILAEHFEPDVEVATYEDVDELIEKVAFYRKNPAAALAIAERGRVRAHRDHTYERRLQELLRISLE